MQPKGSIRLIQVSRWRSATRFDNLSQKQVMQLGNKFNSGKSADGAQQFTWTSSTQQLALTTSTKIRSCNLRDQFGSYKSTDGDQQLALTTSAKIRSCSLRDQFGSYKLTDGNQQLALTTSAKSRSCSLGISSNQANQSTEPSSSHGQALLSNSI